MQDHAMKLYRSADLIKAGYTVGIFRSESGTSDEVHAHEFIEILYVTAGVAEHMIDDAVYEVKHGDILFINYGCRHAFRACRDFAYINICFSPEVVADTLLTQENAPALLTLTAFDDMRGERSAGKLSFSGEDRRQVEWLIEYMLREYEEERPFSAGVMEHCMSLLITMMLRADAGTGTVMEHDRLDELRDYIDKNLGDTLTLSALAKRSFYNPSYFSRMFKARFGVSLRDYVARRRVDTAIALLEEGAPTDEIIRRAGFADRKAYYHAFEKYKGTSPTSYRKGKKT